MLASIIIVTYQSADQIVACLAAVEQLDGRDQYELIVLDNASNDGSAELVRTRFPQSRLIVEQENWGFAGGVNRAVAQAQGQYILLLNPDALPEPAWATALLAALQVPKAGIVGSKVLEPNETIQSVGTLLDQQRLLTAHRGGGETDTGQYDAPADVDAVHGAAMACSAALWHELGGFDEGFFPAYWEEVDLCERARRAGYTVQVIPQAVVHHAEASSTGKYSAQFYGFYLRNRLRYAAKWYSWQSLWNIFRPAEHVRLTTAPLLDRQIAKLVYDMGVPALDQPNGEDRDVMVQFGKQLGSDVPLEAATITAHIQAAAANSVHKEVEFRSTIPAVAAFRRAWNNIATRWYVRPNLDQQTRYNLAIERALQIMIEQEAARSASQALDIALLASQVEKRFH